MLILDDILLAPFKGVLWVIEKIHKATVEEIEAQHSRITSEMSELYMMLETGKITEDEFDQKEQQLLDRLDKLDELRKGR
ncbi:MAG: gas vesicle protein GvpG [Syntrophobacteraceae bacterium]